MPYETKFKTTPYRNSLTFISPGTDGSPAIHEVESSGVIPTRSYTRLGSNNPLNGPLLAYLNKSKPLRVRSYIKKVIVGYRYGYKKVWFNVWRRKKVFSHYTYSYTVEPRIIFSKRRPGRWRFVLKQIRRRHKHFRYVEVVRLKYKKISFRIPVKVRTKIYFTIPPKVVAELPTGRPYLLPNPLTYAENLLRVKPLQNSSGVPARITDSLTLMNASTEGVAITPLTTADGYTFGIGRGVWFSSSYDPFLPVVDDIYLSATALHGLYKKVADDVPSTLTSLAELPESIKAVYDILRDGIKLAKELRKMDARNAYKLINTRLKRRKDSLSGVSSKVWLSWYLAVSPTISDVADHVETFKREDRLWRKFQKTARLYTSTEDEYAPYNYYYHSNNITSIKWSTIINGRLTMDEFKDKFRSSGSQEAAVYAVIPFSFIADWIVNVSTYLESARIFQDLDYTAWKTSSTYIETVEKSSIIGYDSTHFAFTNERNTFNSRQFRVDREPISELPDMPLIPWKKSLVDETLINRSLTAASLFRVLLSKKN